MVVNEVKHLELARRHENVMNTRIDINKTTCDAVLKASKCSKNFGDGGLTALRNVVSPTAGSFDDVGGENSDH